MKNTQKRAVSIMSRPDNLTSFPGLLQEDGGQLAYPSDKLGVKINVWSLFGSEKQNILFQGGYCRK